MPVAGNYLSSELGICNCSGNFQKGVELLGRGMGGALEEQRRYSESEGTPTTI